MCLIQRIILETILSIIIFEGIRNCICVTQLEIAKFYLELDILRIVTLSVSIL